MTTPEDQTSGKDKTIVFTSPSNTTLVYAIGDIVGKSYILLSLLARGGMGVLFKAKHIQLDRIFALKLLPPNQVSEINWRRFEIEGRALAKLNHPNIVQIYNMGVDQKGCPFYVMELLEGQSMAEYIEEQTMPIEQFVQSFKDVCAALQLSHSKGIVHRDIKPSNLFMVQSSSSSSSSSSSTIKSTKVVDFGIARLTGSEGQNLQGLTRPGEVFGSPAYMSPEQTEGKAVTLASDIYSLGCTMYAALTGHAPFKGATAIQTMMAHQTDSAPSINRLDFSPEQNTACNEIIASCMEKAPEDRFDNVEQIAERLSEISKDANNAGEHSIVRTSRDTKHDDTTTNHLASSERNQKKWLTITALTLTIVTAAIVSVASNFTSLLLKQKEEIGTQTTNVITDHLTPTFSPKEKEVIGEKLVMIGSDLPNDPDVTANSRKVNPLLSQVVSIEGKKHRVFTFPRNSHIGKLANNKAVEKKNIDSGLSSQNIRREAIGTINWPDDEPVSFTAGIKISKNPEIYDGFDNLAIDSLTLKSAEVLPPIETLRKWSNLKNLHFHGCKLNSAYTKDLDKLKQLQSLTFDHTKFDADALAKIGLLRRLRSLQLEQIEDHSIILQAVEHSEKLQRLEVRALLLSESDIERVATLPNLSSLDLRWAVLPNSAMKKLSQMSNLTFLYIDPAAYNPNALVDLGSSQSLKTVHVSSDKPSDQALEPIRRRYPHIKVIRQKPPQL